MKLFSPENILGSFQNFKYHTTRVAILITAISLIVLILLQQSFAKKLKVIPAPLLVVIIVLLQILFSQMLLPTFH